MRTLFCIALLLVLVALPAMAADEAKPIRAVVLTGGHGYDEQEFPKLFADMKGIEITYAAQKGQSELFEDITDWPYDVIVLYTMSQNISEVGRNNLKKLLDDGVGLVALHHAMSGFTGWPEYFKIIGARYFLEDTVEDGVTYPTCTYRHDIDFTIRVADPDHPVTKGLADFEMHDETYKGYRVYPGNRILLTTDHSESSEQIGWVRRSGNANVCTIQMGHGPQAFTQPQYQQLVGQSIRWAAGPADANASGDAK